MGNDGRLKSYFFSEVAFNLNNKVLSDLETLSFINEADLKRDFADVSRKMRCKWHFRNDITINFSKTPAFHNKST